MKDNRIIILGAGLVGSLLSILLAKKGFKTTVFEKRSDPRSRHLNGGRSINLALSHRGIRSLKLAGAYDKIASDLIPMHGRMMHNQEGTQYEQPYGKRGEFINSVSRAGLNVQLIDEAAKIGVDFQFDHKLISADADKGEAILMHDHQEIVASADLLIGADGAFSALRAQVLGNHGEYKESYIEHGYKELNIEPANGDFALAPNYLHIWPRGNFMLIALPNPDKTFTATLFFPLKGSYSFESVQSDEDIRYLFQHYFPDVVPLIQDVEKQFNQNPTATLVTISCYPWTHGKALIIGDAAHAIVPFYGQGMNSGFEDCRLFMEIAEKNQFDWKVVLKEFQNTRKPDADAISELALKNFVEMRDSVADTRFLHQKKLEAELSRDFPNIWKPLYSMVTFSDIPYEQALTLGKLQQEILDQYPDLTNLTEADKRKIVDEFSRKAPTDQTTFQ